MACVQPISRGGGERLSGWQPVSPQVSPSNELWTSCFGRAGMESLQNLRNKGQGAGGPELQD